MLQPPDELLAALDKSFQIFLETAHRYPRESVREKPSLTAFSATEIVYHMLDVERLWQARIRGLIDGSMRHFQQMDPDAVAAERRYNEKDYEAGIADLRTARTETEELVRSMKPSDWRLVGTHSKYGDMDAVAILTTMENHDRTHAAQLERTLRQIEQRVHI